MIGTSSTTHYAERMRRALVRTTMSDRDLDICVFGRLAAPTIKEDRPHSTVQTGYVLDNSAVPR